MTTDPCPSWCSLGDECEGYHWSQPVAPMLPITTGREWGDGVVVTLGQLASEEGHRPTITISPEGEVVGVGDSLSMYPGEVRKLITALDDALFVLGEVTEMTRLRQRMDSLERVAEESKTAWLQACDDAGTIALDVEERDQRIEALERRLSLIQAMASGQPDGERQSVVIEVTDEPLTPGADPVFGLTDDDVQGIGG